MSGAWIDFALTRLARLRASPAAPAVPGIAWVDTPAGRVRVFDSATSGPCVVFTPDGPNAIEHCLPMLHALMIDHRVVCFDMPGFGLSLPAPSYAHSLDEGAHAVLAVLDALAIRRATLAFSCANGFYAIRAARLAPDRVHSLMLAQTPSLSAMHAWTRRTVPRVIGLPYIGQLVAWIARRRAARSWYRAALPIGADAEPFRKLAAHTFACGGCFGLAGVVQGLVRESDLSLTGVTVPCTLLWGAADRSHHQTPAHSLLDLLPHARIVSFSDSGHFPDAEHPARYASLLRQHLFDLPADNEITHA